MNVLAALLRSWRLSKADEDLGPCFMDSLPYNPLLNPLIIAKVFAYSGQKDLLNYRLVCKSWNGFATSLLQSNSYATVRQESDLKRLLRLTKHSSNSFPITRFYIKLATLDNTSHLLKTLSMPTIVSLKVVIPSKLFPQSLRTIQQHMKSLRHLVICRLPELSFEAIVSVSADTERATNYGFMPKLISLTLRNGNPNRNFLATYDLVVSDFIRSARSLKSLDFCDWNCLARVFRECPLDSLKSLRVIGGKVSEGDLVVLMNKKELKLERFVARVDRSVRKELLDQFLKMRVGAATSSNCKSGSGVKVRVTLPLSSSPPS
ncbi:unnamed protein product [Orchesella dallaii]|uniref:F-box domain-containing protein n=1 Tax=Orchesella dallaii TaxID=48710 RepID=A0ABP1R3P7_9HEXA